MSPASVSRPGGAQPGGQRDTFEELRSWIARGVLPEELDREQALAFAGLVARHGLAGLLDDALAADAPAWTREAAGPLRQAHRAILASSLRQLELAGRVLHVLESAGVPALPLKGAAVAEALYDSPGHRAMTDVDVLVLDDWRRGLAALTTEGYVASHHADHAVCLRDPDTGDPVELHRSATSCPGLFPLDPRGLWQRRRRGSGLVPWLPDSVDGLILLALHAAFQHGLALRLGQYLDLRRALEREPLDVGELIERGRRAGALGCLGVALSAARDLVAAPLASPLPQSLDEAMSAGQRAIARSFAARPQPWLGADPGRLARVRWSVCRGRRTRLLLLTLAPSTGDGPAKRVGARWMAMPRRALSLLRRLLRPAPRR